MKKRKLLKIVGLFIGLVFLTFWLKKLGPEVVLKTVLNLKWWVFPLLINSLLWNISYTAAWRLYFTNLKRRIPFLPLLKVKLCGEAINLVTPMGFVAGDPVRVMMLKKYLGGESTLGSVVVDRLINSLASVFFILTGLLLVSPKAMGVSSSTHWIFFAFYFVLTSFLTFLVIELIRGKGMRLIHVLLKKLGLLSRFNRLESLLIECHHELAEFSGGSMSSLFLSFLYHLAGRVLGAVEISIIFMYLDGSPHLASSVLLASLTAVFHLMFAFFPGAIGIIETFYAGFFYYHGLNPALGFSMQLIRRLRSLFWVVLGIFLLQGKASSASRPKLL